MVAESIRLVPETARYSWTFDNCATSLRSPRHNTSVVPQGFFLHIAQPALSRQIRLLEEKLGVWLFVRHPKSATPTKEAMQFLDRATFVLRYVDQLKADIVASASTS